MAKPFLYSDKSIDPSIEPGELYPKVWLEGQGELIRDLKRTMEIIRIGNNKNVVHPKIANEF